MIIEGGAGGVGAGGMGIVGSALYNEPILTTQ